MAKSLKDLINLLLPKNIISPKIVFRVDAGKIQGLSFGHLSRCLTLARGFRNMHCAKTLFMMRDYSDGVKYAQNMGQCVKILPDDLSSEQETEQTMRIIEEFEADVVIVDLPYLGLDTSYFTMLKHQGKQIVFIDDVRYMTPTANIILNSSILALEKTPQVVDENICYLLGPEYFIFEEPQRNLRNTNQRTRTFHVLITFGGSDPAGLTLKITKYLSKKRWNNMTFSIIIGPGFNDTQEMQTFIHKSKNNIRVVNNPVNIYSYFLDCDLAICSGGRTLYELYTLEIPIIAVASIEHEVPVVRAFLEQHKIITGLESWEESIFHQQFCYALDLQARNDFDKGKLFYDMAFTTE